MRTACIVQPTDSECVRAWVPSPWVLQGLRGLRGFCRVGTAGKGCLPICADPVARELSRRGPGIVHQRVQRGTLIPRPPLFWVNNALVRTTAGVVSATFGTVSYFTLDKHPTCNTNIPGVVFVNFWDYSVVSRKGVGGGLRWRIPRRGTGANPAGAGYSSDPGIYMDCPMH